MTTRLLFREDPYLRDAPARVIAHTPEGGIILDASVFYPTGGGQPGDSGFLVWDGIEMPIATTVLGPGREVVLVPSEPQPLPEVGTHLVQYLDWERRHRHMRVHTALHLLSVVVPLPVTGGAITSEKGRLDFNMPDAPADRDVIEESLHLLIERDLPVSETWVTDEVLAATPELVKTMSVKPPRGQGRVRLVRIGKGGDQVDLQPCGGTHVARTGEIGAIRLGKIEKKGRQNRRMNILFDA
ncbi:alanyl-tRNA editing protein [Marinovum sp. 2_MG-2023]|uniref:alanyl-tRNA editing protein n=1 Tax=Roseobacteraceae TaxID=2854170 RepID=UPI001FD3E550|nr:MULTISPECIES: alanyl-tRNA editing protein [Roseobacteraceae]MCJ7872166.1 alanyl-tRNA editing protein [Phaeobacter sp. J2-8]MDO6729576.1 alanyl-tRNA editing protein [Marinovum sp. 2_MG-2023]MDO6780270.1 alanyl-tRNA editing protein [Marinovum sp. 1_MG-2023]